MISTNQVVPCNVYIFFHKKKSTHLCSLKASNMVKCWQCWIRASGQIRATCPLLVRQIMHEALSTYVVKAWMGLLRWMVAVLTWLNGIDSSMVVYHEDLTCWSWREELASYLPSPVSSLFRASLPSLFSLASLFLLPLSVPFLCLTITAISSLFSL
mgnify:CR=1 FL=1